MKMTGARIFKCKSLICAASGENVSLEYCDHVDTETNTNLFLSFYTVLAHT